MELLGKPPRRKVLWILKYILAAVLLVLGVLLLYFSNLEAGRYQFVNKDAVSVTGEVIRIEEEWDSEGDSDWVVYVTYTYEGREYTGEYDTYGNQNTVYGMMGQMVQVRINPHNPSEQVKEIKSGAQSICILGGVLLALGLRSFGIRGQGYYTEAFGWRRETIKKEIQAQLFRKMWSWIALLAMGIVYTGIWFMHPDALFLVLPLGGIALLAIGVVKLCKWAGDFGCLRRGEYRVSRNSVCDRSVVLDSDGPDDHYIHSFNDDIRWKRKVDYEVYQKVKVGDIVETVYFGNDKAPWAYYLYGRIFFAK